VARASKVQLATGTADVQAYTGSGNLMGYSIMEDAGAPAVGTVILRDGIAATADIIAVVELGANGSTTQWFGPQGIPFNVGIYVDRVAGSCSGALYIG
jgi:hypothetical protein